MTTSPWSTLTPERVLDTLEAILKVRLNALCLSRNSYINRVFEVESDNGDRYIAKFYRPNRWTPAMIQGELDFLDRCYQAELPVIPALNFDGKNLFRLGEIYVAIFPKKGGRAIDELNQELWEETGRLLGRLHTLSHSLPKPDRVLWRPAVATQRHLDQLLALKMIPSDYQSVLTTSVQRFIQTIDPKFDTVEYFLVHGDCHFGNLIYRPGESMYIVDFDDCVIGPAVQDLWMLLPDDPEYCAQEMSWFRSGYTVFRDFPNQELALIPALKVMRQIHYAAWCAMQVGEAQFEHHFPEWGSTRYWNQLTKDIQQAL